MTKLGRLGLQLGVMAVVLQLICPVSSLLFPENDIACLNSTYGELNDPQDNLYTWYFKNPTKGFICNFLGITCWHNDDNKVMSISLAQMGLRGEFPSGVKYRGSMTSLSLSRNNLTGTIPKELCLWLPYLVTHDLSYNNFTGPIPPELHNCAFLNVLDLNGNQLTGPVPWQLTRLDRLKDLNVAGNKLSGAIPTFSHNFSASNFQNNPLLCGPPLSKACGNGGSINPMAVAAFLLFGIVLIVWILLALWWMISEAKNRRSVKIPLPTSKEPSDWQKYVRARRSVKVSLFEKPKKPIRQMRLADLVAANDDFSTDNIILCGRTGVLYKGKLSDGPLLAVKRLRPCSQSAKDFKCEMKTLGQLRHRNLVPLLGYCITEEERFLVYKYLARGTLLNCLHGVHGDRNTLDWATRLKSICMGTGRGLAWLHHNCDPHIVHRNISSAIVFLDEDYEPHISGFRLARVMNADDSNCVTISCSGEMGDEAIAEEFGYIAPEAWTNSSIATLKSDVYSLGIVVIEIMSGLRPCDTIMDEESRKEMTFLEWIHARFLHEGVDSVEQAIQRYRENGMSVSSDEWILRLFAQNDCTVEQVTQSYRANQITELLDEDISVVAEVMRVAFECINFNPDERPSMHEVYKSLTKIAERYCTISDDDEEA